MIPYGDISFLGIFFPGYHMNDAVTLIVLGLVLVFLIAVHRSASAIAPVCPPPERPPVMQDLGPEKTTPLGVPADMIRAIYSVVEAAPCVPDAPTAKASPSIADVRHITTQACRRMSQGTAFDFHPGNTVYSVVWVDAAGIGTYYITTMLYERTSSITLRVSLKARMRVHSDDAPHILNASFDPFHADPDADEPCRAGSVPDPRPESLDTSIYKI